MSMHDMDFYVLTYVTRPLFLLSYVAAQRQHVALRMCAFVLSYTVLYTDCYSGVLMFVSSSLCYGAQRPLLSEA